MEEKKDHRPIVRLVQLVFFFVLYYGLVNLLLNYAMLSIKFTAAFEKKQSTKGIFEFNAAYLIKPPADFDLFMVIMITFVLSIITVLKLDTLYNISHGNKEIKGKDRFLTVKELDKYFYSFPDNDMTAAEKSGIIIAHENGRYYIDSETIHSLIIGTTRSGKGQTFVMPMIRHICYSKTKHSLVMNDPKGELLENCYGMLIENGYTVVVLNLRDTEMSSLWNPLQVIIDEYVYARKNNKDLSKCIKLITSLADTFTHNAQSDPIWPESAKSLLIAMILYLLQQGYEKKCIEKVSMYSVYQMFIEFGQQNERRGNKEVNALDELFRELQAKDPTNPAVSAYAVSRFSSGEMRSSIFSTLASNINIFGSDTGISKLTSGNQINFKELVNPEKPMAVFMVVPDNDTSRHIIASLFVNQCYNTLVELSSKCQGQKLPQRVHFILDEFGNMIRIPDMDTKITVGAGRNLLFNLFVQDLNQLDTKYDNAAKTIRSNCGNMIYINSLDKDTNEYFSSILGTKTVEYTTYSGKLQDWIDQRSLVVEGQALMTASELSTMPFGSAITKRQRMYPIKTKFEPFFKLGIPLSSLDTISRSMTLLDIPLSDTIFDMSILWRPLFVNKVDGRTGEVMVETDENGFSHNMTNWNDMRKALEKRAALKTSAPTSVKTDFSQSVDDKIITDTAEQIIIKRIDDYECGKFTTAYNNHDWTGLEKLVKVSHAKSLISTEERNLILKYIENSHNV